MSEEEIITALCAVDQEFAINDLALPYVEEAVRLGYLKPIHYWTLTDAGRTKLTEWERKP